METTPSASTENVQEMRIQIVPNGPALVLGKVKLIDQQGRTEHKETMFALCRCGASHKKPYCDGTHNYNGFTD